MSEITDEIAVEFSKETIYPSGQVVMVFRRAKAIGLDLDTTKYILSRASETKTDLSLINHSLDLVIEKRVSVSSDGLTILVTKGKDLIDQIEKGKYRLQDGEYVDSEEHRLTNNVAFLEFKQSISDLSSEVQS